VHSYIKNFNKEGDLIMAKKNRKRYTAAEKYNYHAKRENDFQARRAQCANSRGGSVAANLVTPSVSENYSISWARGYRDSHSPHFIGAEARAKEYAADLKQAKREYYVQSAAKRGYCNGVKAGLATRKK